VKKEVTLKTPLLHARRSGRRLFASSISTYGMRCFSSPASRPSLR